MHNFNFLRPNDPISDENRILDDGIVSYVGDDYLLSFLNDSEPVQKNLPQSNSFVNPYYHEFQLPYIGYQDPIKPLDTYYNGSGKMNVQESWAYQNVYEQNKAQSNLGNVYEYKTENEEDDDEDGDRKLKKIKTTIDSGLSVKKDLSIPWKQKSNHRNTYVDKINQLMTETTFRSDKDEDLENSPLGLTSQAQAEAKKNLSIKNSSNIKNIPQRKTGGMKKVRSYDVLHYDESNKAKARLARNRESAKQSRKRKKEYVELLEKKVEQLQQELTITSKQLEQHSDNLNAATAQNKILNNLFINKQQSYDKLEKMITNNVDENEIGFIIDSLKLRFGANGKERVNAINFFFKQIIDFIFPIHVKYLLSIATQEKDIFNNKNVSLLQKLPQGLVAMENTQNDTTEYWQEIVSELGLTEHQKKTIQKYKKKFSGEKMRFEGLIKNLNQVRKNLIKQEGCLQNLMDELSASFTPLQIAKFILIMDKERNKKEFSSEKFWFHPSVKKENEENISEETDNFLECEEESKL